jgi:hypothetical protein
MNDIGNIKTNIVKGYVNQDLGKQNPSARHLKIAFLSDGFPESDMGTFHQDVERNMRYLLNYIEPYKSRADQIQYFSIDNTDDIGCQKTTETVVLQAQQIPTEIMICDTAKITQRVQQAGQPWDVIVLITRRSLGRYSSYPWANIATIGTGFNMEQIFAHEFGHALADLEDEYTYSDSDIGPEDNQIHQNCLHSSNSTLWNNIVPAKDIVGGCTYKNYFRPSNESIMNNHLDADYYNAPSQDVIVHKIDQVAGRSSDVTPPSIKVNINQNQLVSGIFNVIGEAKDDKGTMRVEFYLDNTLIHTSYTAPHSFEWNSSSISNGEHTIYAKAYDASDNSASTSAVNFSVNNAEKVPDSAANAVPDYRNWGILLFHKLQDILK